MDNELVKALQTIMTRKGKETLADSTKMNALLADLVPNLARDRKIILRFFDSGIIKDFIGDDIAMAMGKAKSYFYDEEFMSTERAEYYLDVLAETFGYTRTDRIVDESLREAIKTEDGKKETEKQKEKLNILEVTDGLVKRGYISLKDGDFDKADDCFERALDQNPESSRAYVGKMLCERHLQTFEDLKNLDGRIDEDKNFKKAVQYADTDYRRRLNSTAALLKEKQDQKLVAEQKKRQADAEAKADSLMQKVMNSIANDKANYLKLDGELQKCRQELDNIESQFNKYSADTEHQIEAVFGDNVGFNDGNKLKEIWDKIYQEQTKSDYFPGQKELSLLNSMKSETERLVSSLKGKQETYKDILSKMNDMEVSYSKVLQNVNTLADNMKSVSTEGLKEDIFRELLKCVVLGGGTRTLAQVQSLSKTLNATDLQVVKRHASYLISRHLLKEKSGKLAIN